MANAKLPAPELRVTSVHGTASVGDTLRAVRGEALRIEAGGAAYAGARMALVWRGETVAAASLGTAGTALLTHYPAANGYLRAHFTAADGQPLAITNPVWIRVEAR
jgi:hypothetical protein